jgi:hypothetical protein
MTVQRRFYYPKLFSLRGYEPTKQVIQMLDFPDGQGRKIIKNNDRDE